MQGHCPGEPGHQALVRHCGQLEVGHLLTHQDCPAEPERLVVVERD